jgi:hypothetical protein
VERRPVDLDLAILVSATVVSVASAALSVVAGARTARLQHELSLQRSASDRKSRLDDTMAAYRGPLLRAAVDLQSRFYNIAEKRFLRRYFDRSEAEREYATTSTLYVIAEYLGWAEILRREIQYLDLGDPGANRTLADLLERITTWFLTDRVECRFRLFRGEQRAIGELMVGPAPPGARVRHECLGYATFADRLGDPEFARWFAGLTTDVAALAARDDAKEDRLVGLQHALIDLIDFLDPERTRVPEQRRRKIAPSGVPGSGSDALPDGDGGGADRAALADSSRSADD